VPFRKRLHRKEEMMDPLRELSSQALAERLPVVPAGDDSQSPPVDFAWAWTAVVKRWWIVAATTLAILIPTGAYLLFAPTWYIATAVIRVSPESAKALPYRDLIGPMQGGGLSYELYMKTYDGILKSRELQVRARSRLKTVEGLSRATNIETDLASEPQIQRIEGSELVTLSYVAKDPDLAASAANIWAEEFIGLDFERKRKVSERATEFLREQLRGLKQQVEEAEAAVLDFARNKEILDLDDSSENVVRRRFSQLSEELAKTEKNYLTQKAEYAGLEDLSFDTLPETLKKPVITELENRVFEAEQELVRLQGQFDNKWPAVVQKRKELDLLNEQLQRAKAQAFGQAFRESKMKLNAASREFEMLRQSVDKQAALVNRLNTDLAKFNTLTREFQTTNQLYQTLLQRLKETGVVAGLELENISVVDRAVSDPKPYRPRRALTFLLALTASLVLGTGLCIGVESAYDTLSRPDDAEKMGLPLLGWIPKLDPPQDGESVTGHQFAHRVLEAGSASGKDLQPHERITSSQWCARESYRMLCSSLLLTRAGGPPQAILVSSACAREGKTTAVTALGTTFAELGHATLLIDGDLRKPSLSRNFGGLSKEGLSTYLSGGGIKIQPTGVPNLSCLPSGPLPPNPLALFGSARMNQLFQELKRHFSIVIIDSPPVLGLADTTVLASKVDGVILVARAGQTPRSMIRQAIQQIRRAGATLLGAAVNQVEIRGAEYSYYGRYADTYGKTEANPPAA
jgi:capsular exopolysaccharide synthesis family protein